MPAWEPIDGDPLLLHPERLQTLLIYGHGDLTGAALGLLWRHGVEIGFVGRQGTELLARLSPPSDAPSLACWQHWACRDEVFCLRQARRLIMLKIEGILQVCAHLSRHGQGPDAGARRLIQDDAAKAERAADLSSLRGHEGAAAARWHGLLRGLFPASMPYHGRNCHPPRDPVNALLSLGYTILLGRVQAYASAVGLDPTVGVLHQMRAGRPALVCDLIEPFRAPLVDQLVVGLARQGILRREHFESHGPSFRLKCDAFRRFVSLWEERYESQRTGDSFRHRVESLIRDFAKQTRDWRG
jgi:CRISPR-associated protein Cas1